MKLYSKFLLVVSLIVLSAQGFAIGLESSLTCTQEQHSELAINLKISDSFIQLNVVSGSELGLGRNPQTGESGELPFLYSNKKWMVYEGLSPVRRTFHISVDTDKLDRLEIGESMDLNIQISLKGMEAVGFAVYGMSCTLTSYREL